MKPSLPKTCDKAFADETNGAADKANGIVTAIAAADDALIG